jgi:Flp pilus assembly protein TadG
MKLPVVKKQRERGNAFVEFALVSLIMLPLFFGVIDYSRVFYYAAVVQGAARAGTQYAVFQAPNQSNTAGIQSAAQNDAASVAGTLTVNSSTFCVCAGSTAQYACSGISCGSAATYGYWPARYFVPVR